MGYIEHALCYFKGHNTQKDMDSWLYHQYSIKFLWSMNAWAALYINEISVLVGNYSLQSSKLPSVFKHVYCVDSW